MDYWAMLNWIITLPAPVFSETTPPHRKWPVKSYHAQTSSFQTDALWVQAVQKNGCSKNVMRKRGGEKEEEEETQKKTPHFAEKYQ